MIPKSGERFSGKIMLQQVDLICAKKNGAASSGSPVRFRPPNKLQITITLVPTFTRS